jgi:hypothetical protein
MNSFKTELFKISFNPRQSMVGKNDDVIRAHVTITHEKSERYLDFFTLAALCIEVDDMLQDGAIDAIEAIKIIRKSASFFILNGE